MGRRSTSLASDSIVSIDREIGSQYDNVKLVADNLDSIELIVDNLSTIEAVDTNIDVINEVVPHIDDIALLVDHIDGTLSTDITKLVHNIDGTESTDVPTLVSNLPMIGTVSDSLEMIENVHGELDAIRMLEEHADGARHAFKYSEYADSVFTGNALTLKVVGLDDGVVEQYGVGVELNANVLVDGINAGMTSIEIGFISIEGELAVKVVNKSGAPIKSLVWEYDDGSAPDYEMLMASMEYTYVSDLATVSADLGSTKYDGGTKGAIEYVADNMEDVEVVAEYVGDVNLVSANMDEVKDVSDNISKVQSVAANMSDVAQVSGSIVDVERVAAIDSDVGLVADARIHVNVVATNLDSIDTVAASIGNVNAVASIDDDVQTVASNITDVQNAEGNASAAIDAANEAASSEELAQKWASEDRDVVVEAGKYSAKHWAEVAQSVSDITDLEARVSDNEAELDRKADKYSTVTLFATTASGDYGYSKAVTSPSDAGYDSTAVNISIPSTGSLSSASSPQMVGAMISDSDVFVGELEGATFTTKGQIRRQGDGDDSGSKDYYASFYFEVYKRASGGAETLVGTSTSTGAVQAYDRPDGGYQFEEFSSEALIVSGGEWVDTDRMVIKWYADTTNADSDKCAYEFQFGGDMPVRTGAAVSSAVVAGLPDQSGHSGKALVTDGENVRWDELYLDASDINFAGPYGDVGLDSQVESNRLSVNNLSANKLDKSGGTITGDLEVTGDYVGLDEYLGNQITKELI